MVFIKKASISREVWLGRRRRAGEPRSGGGLPPEFSNNAVIYAAAEVCTVF